MLKSCACDSAVATAGRRFWVGGNWKMNGNKESIAALCEQWKAQKADASVGACVCAIVCVCVCDCVRVYGRRQTACRGLRCGVVCLCACESW